MACVASVNNCKPARPPLGGCQEVRVIAEYHVSMLFLSSTLWPDRPTIKNLTGLLLT